MQRRAYVVTARWPTDRLTWVGKATSCFTNGAINHIGILVTDCTPEEIEAHSEYSISHPSARGARHVTFDFVCSKIPKFQSIFNKDYWIDECVIICYPILNVQASDVHGICVEVARARPYNKTLFRLNRLLFCGCLPCHMFPSNTDRVAQSHCGVLSLRIVASAKMGSDEPLASDALALSVLGIPEDTVCGLWPRVLTSYTPAELVAKMRAARAVGDPIDSFPVAGFREPRAIPLRLSLPMATRRSNRAYARVRARAFVCARAGARAGPRVGGGDALSPVSSRLPILNL